jgi:hypothetical protein
MKYANIRDCMNVGGKWTKPYYYIIWGMQVKSHMMAYDKQLTNFTLMYTKILSSKWGMRK